MSFTQLATFLRCPLEYKLRFKDKKIRASPSGTQVRWGRLLHTIASEYLRLPTDQRSLHFLATRLHEEASTRSLSDQEDQVTIFAHSIRFFHDLFTEAEVYEVEAPFRTALHPLYLTGRADAIVQSEDGLILFEFKRSDYREFDYESELDRYLQLVFYSLGLRGRQLRPVEPMQGAYYFFDSGKRDSVALSEHLMSTGKARLMQITGEIRKMSSFKPKENRLCPTCGYRKQCRLYRRRR